LSAVFSVALGLAASPAQAAWSKLTTVDSGAYLMRVQSPDGVVVATGGLTVQQAGMTFQAKQHVHGSRNRGRQFSEISGSLLNDADPMSVTAITFIDRDHGWVGIGNKVYRTSDGGTTWDATVAGSTTRDLHFFDAQNGVRVGDNGAIGLTTNGGATWEQKVTGVDADLQRTFWLDRDHGWVSGYWQDVDKLATRAVVLRTSDGGQTWQSSAILDGYGAGAIHFVGDGQTGWLAALKHNRQGEPDVYASEAHLFRSTDGGATWQDTNLPLEVGKLSSFGFTNPIKTARIHGMYWADAQRGHLAAGAYLGSSTAGSSGGMTSTSQTTWYWKIVDYFTTDGGATWQKTELGTLMSSLNSPPPSDGPLTDATFSDLYNGWYVASSSVFGTSKSCTTDVECGDAYRCLQSRCETAEPPAILPDGGTLTRADGGTAEEDADRNFVKAGCECGSTSAPVLGLLALALIVLRKRRAHDA
jgi:MYXO-CTERM domain-containing protein